MVTLLELEQIEIKVKKTTWSNKDKRDRENEERNHRCKYRLVGWKQSVTFCWLKRKVQGKTNLFCCQRKSKLEFQKECLFIYI